MQRKVFLRIFLTILVGMGVAMGLVRGFTEAMGANSQTILGRVLEGREGLERLLVEDEGDVVMVFGSSMADAGFGPREFDQWIADRGGSSSAWNFGFGGLNPMFQEYLARRMAEDFQRNDRRLKLLLIEFNPFQATKTRRNRAAAIEEPYMSLLASPAEIWDQVLEDPESGIRIAQIRYLRDGISAESITTYFLAEPFSEPEGDLDPGIERNEEVEARIAEIGDRYFPLFREEFPEYADCDWCFDWKGGNALRSERSEELGNLLAEYYVLARNDYRMGRDRLSRIRTADIEELDFDEDLVVAFINLVNAFKPVADNIEVIMLPKNTEWIKNPPDALERQRVVVERIERETGVRVRDFQHLEVITPEMFSDTTHLNALDGRDAFTKSLVDEYGRLLGAAPEAP